MGQQYVNIQPGDIGFTKGGGLVGWIIRHGSGSAYAHSFVYHRLISNDYVGTQTWETIEAYPSIFKNKDGVRKRIRTEKPDKVVRLWRTKKEQAKILEKSESLVGKRYGWGEIFRIALRFVGIKIKGWESEKRVICSNHCAQSILNARPKLDTVFKFKPSFIWPGYLAEVCDVVVWTQEQLRKLEYRSR